MKVPYFAALLSLIPEVDRKHFIVEFDAEGGALNAAAKSYQYLRSLSF
jgi:hypothetical protein